MVPSYVFVVERETIVKYIFSMFYWRSQRSQDRKWITIVKVNLKLAVDVVNCMKYISRCQPRPPILERDLEILC